jgi:diguanylate cyclase (GGDEF)-like protein/PAS domain S-box-containing protein
MPGFPSSNKGSGTGLRLRLLAYFIATIAVIVTLACYAFYMHSEHNARLLQLGVEEQDLRELHGRASNALDRELRTWKNLLLRGAEPGLYHELLSKYYQAERASRRVLGELADSLADDPELGRASLDLPEAHLSLGRQRRAALRIFNATTLDAHTLADRLTRDMEGNPYDVLVSLSGRAQSLQNARVVRIEQEMQHRQKTLLFGGALLTGFALLGFFLLVDRQVGQPAQQAAELAALIEEAEGVAKFGAWEWDLRGGDQHWSPGMYRMLSIDPEQPASRQRMLEFVHEEDRGMVEERTRAAVQQCGTFDLEYRVVIRGGVERVIQDRGSAIPGNDGRSARLTGIIYDITERKLAEARLTELANYDPLTGLPNRSLLMDRLDHATLQADRNRTQLAILFLDLDGFKAVNDAMGHAAGDQLLKQAAGRLRACLRKSDTVARLGGDEFTVILEQVDDKEVISNTVMKLLDTLRECFDIDGREIFISASVGIAYFPDDATSMEDLLKHADAAMYRAKSDGRDGYSFFTEELNRQAQDRLIMESSLRLAMGRKDFFLHYQPQINIATGELVGAEALLRWQHDGQPVSPKRFLPILEETGLILPVGVWILDRACRDLRTWREEVTPDLRMAVNLSVRQLSQANLVEMIQQTLARHGLKGADIELEITESAVGDGGIDMSIFDRLRAMGVQLAIDDFGTGYSSLSRLKILPVDNLKIDRSFIKDIGIDSNDDALTSAIIALAHRFDLRVTGEGVETARQLDFLRAEGCDQVQGYLFARPMEFTALRTWYAERYGSTRVAL